MMRSHPFSSLSFSLILNLASVCNAETSEILWGFIENYYGKVDKEKYPYLEKLLQFGVEYYNKFVLPEKKYREPNVLSQRQRIFP